MANKTKETVKSTDGEESYEVSLSQLIEDTKSRSVITCTLSADIGLGGGIPLGCTVLVGGKPKLGKTTSVLTYAANAQRQFGSEVYLFPAEGRLTNQTISQVQGLDLEKTKVIKPPAIYDKSDKVIGHKKWHAQQWWDALGKVISNTNRSVIVLDSISNLSTEKEQSEGMGYQGRGDMQKLEAQFCRSFGDLIIANQITVFLIAQIQANTSGYGAPIQIKAGNAIKHQADIIMIGKKIETWGESSGRILGHDMVYNVECSALGPPFVEIKIPLRYGFGIDCAKDIITHAITWEIIKKGGAWFTLPFVENDGKLEYSEDSDERIKVQGEEQIRNWMLVHPDQLKKLESVIREKVFI